MSGASAMSVMSYFSSIPGMFVPGMAQPGRGQRYAYPLYLYAGAVSVDYLDYVDEVTTRTLVVSPGGYYTMGAVNSRAGLTVPPSDHRWGGAVPYLGFGAERDDDDLAWVPPAHLAHLPVPFEVIAERIRRKQQRSGTRT